MTEIICGIIALVGSVVGAYGYAVSKARREQVDNLKTYAKELKAENKELYSKLLLKNGSTPLGTPTPKPVVNKIAEKPRIVSRQELQQRTWQKEREGESRKVMKPVALKTPTPRRAVEQAGDILK